MRSALVLSKEDVEELSNSDKLEVFRRVMPPFGVQEDWDIGLIKIPKGINRIEGRIKDRSLLQRPSLQSWGIVRALASGNIFSVSIQCPYSGMKCVVKEPFLLSNREVGIWSDSVVVNYIGGNPACRVIEDIPKEDLDRFSLKMDRFLIPPSMPVWMARYIVECVLIDVRNLNNEWVWVLEARLLKRLSSLGLTKGDSCGIIGEK